ncbi:MAG: hypothetical protein ACK54M_13320 [Pseudanabaena sp.]
MALPFFILWQTRVPKSKLLRSIKAQPLKAMVIAKSPSPLTILENGDRRNRE